jgi:hypothetical protein
MWIALNFPTRSTRDSSFRFRLPYWYRRDLMRRRELVAGDSDRRHFAEGAITEDSLLTLSSSGLAPSHRYGIGS